MTARTATCPRCGPTVLRRVDPLLDGTPVSMCIHCHRIDTAQKWAETTGEEEHECRVHYEPDDPKAPVVNDAPKNYGNRDWHADAIGDTGSSHFLVGRRYVIACEWCRCVFIADTQAKALARFRDHEREMIAPERSSNA